MIVLPACASGLRQDVRTLPSGFKSTLWRNQGLPVQNYNYLTFAFKTRGKPRLWRTHDPLMSQGQRDRDNTRDMFASRAFERHCWAIPLDQFKEHCLTVPLAALQSGLQESFIATKRETTSSSHTELNQRKTIEDGTRVTRDITPVTFSRRIYFRVWHNVQWNYKRMLVRQECERQKCERHQCEANSANANSAKGSIVRMRQECECQMCECQQCDATSVRKKCDSSANANSANRIFFLFFSLILIGFGRNGKREPAKTWMRKVTCCPTRTDLFSAHLHLQHLGFNVCVYVNLCANSRGEKGMGRLWYMVLSCNTTGCWRRGLEKTGFGDPGFSGCCRDATVINIHVHVQCNHYQK